MLHTGTFAFASLTHHQSLSLGDVVAMIVEPEGVSVIVAERELSRLGLQPAFLCAWITLTANSDLQAVGLTAAFATALGRAGISCNVVAGTHHDHLFVPLDQAHAAMAELKAPQERAQSAAPNAVAPGPGATPSP